MYVRLTIDITGDPTNPFTVPLPNWSVVAIGLDIGRGILNVPDMDIPSDVRGWLVANPCSSLVVPVVLAMPQSLTDSWWKWLDAHYAEHATKYRPKVA